jgi:type I restriction enzyme S subunit
VSAALARTSPTHSLADFVALKRGYDLPSQDRRDGDVPILGSFGITGRHDEAKHPGPGVSIGRSGASIGVATYTSNSYWPLNTTLYVTDFKGNEPRFVYYVLDSIDFVGFNSGGAIPSLNRNYLSAIPVPDIPIAVQRKVVAVLSSYDDLIENNDRRIKFLEEMAQRIYREWFVDFRYPGHENVPLVDSELGPIPQGWPTGTLSSLVDVNANTIRKCDPDETIRYIDISSVSKGVVSAPRRVSLREAPGRARRRVADGDILWSSVRPNLRAHALVLSPGSDCVASTGFAVLSPRRASFAYIYVMTTTDAFVEYLNGRATGSAYPAVTPPVFQNAPVVLPPQAKLDAFADAADPLMRLAARLGSANSNLRASRDLLLPRLTSGEVDVADLDIAMAEDAA